MIGSIDEPNVEAAPDVWAQGRIAALIARASAEQRVPLEKEIARRWSQVKASNVADMRRFVATLGSLFKVGKEARLQLAERLAQENRPEQPPGSGAASEPAPPDEGRAGSRRPCAGGPGPAGGAPQPAGRRLLLLQRRWATSSRRYRSATAKPVPTTTTDVATDKTLPPLLRGASAGGRLQVKVERGGFPMPRPEFTFEPEGEVLPYFQRHRLTLDFTLNQFKLLDRATNDKPWGESLTRTQFQNYVGYVGNPNSNVRFPYQTVGHLVILNLGQAVYGIDPVHRKKLWERRTRSA